MNETLRCRPTPPNYFMRVRKARTGEIVEGYACDDGLASLLQLEKLEGGCAYVSVLDTVLERTLIGERGRFAIANDERF